jgi:hypothetical protein
VVDASRQAYNLQLRITDFSYILGSVLIYKSALGVLFQAIGNGFGVIFGNDNYHILEALPVVPIHSQTEPTDPLTITSRRNGTNPTRTAV